MTRDDESRRLVGLARRVFTDLRRCLHDLVLCQVVFQVITFVLLAPATAWVLRLFLAAHGERAVGNLDVAQFLLSPIGIVALLGLGAVALAIQFLGLAALMRIGYGAAVLRPVSWRQGVRFAYTHRWGILAVSFLSVLRIVLVLVPFAAVAAFTVQSFLGEHDINFYLATRPAELKAAMAILGVIGIAAAAGVALVCVTIVFSLPDALFRDASAGQAFARSRAMVKRRFFALARPLVALVLVWTVPLEVVAQDTLEEVSFIVERYQIIGDNPIGAAADSVKRVRFADLAESAWARPREVASLRWVEPFIEVKTFWHPVAY